MTQNGDPDTIASAIASDPSPNLAGTGTFPLLEKLHQQQADIKIQIAELSTQFGPSYPKLAQLNNQNKEIDRQIQGESRKAVNHLRGQYQTALQRESMLREALNKQKQEANRLNEKALRYTILKRYV